MAFRLPSVIVYQELTSTNVSNVTPFMDLCVVGPLYQVQSGVACDSFDQLGPDDVYTSEFPGLTLGAEVDKDSVVVAAKDASIRIWPTTHDLSLNVGKVDMENYVRVTNADGTFVTLTNEYKKKTNAEGKYLAEFDPDWDNKQETIKFVETTEVEATAYKYIYETTGEVEFIAYSNGSITADSSDEMKARYALLAVYNVEGEEMDLTTDDFDINGNLLLHAYDAYGNQLGYRKEATTGKDYYEALGKDAFMEIVDEETETGVYKYVVKTFTQVVNEYTGEVTGTEEHELTEADFKVSLTGRLTKIKTDLYNKEGDALNFSFSDVKEIGENDDGEKIYAYVTDVFDIDGNILTITEDSFDAAGNLKWQVFDATGAPIAAYEAYRLFTKRIDSASMVYVNADFAEDFLDNDCTVEPGDTFEITFNLPDGKGGYDQDIVSTTIAAIDQDADGRTFLLLSKFIEDETEFTLFNEGVTATAVVKRSIPEVVLIDSDYVTLLEDNAGFNIAWTMKTKTNDATGKITSRTYEPPLVSTSLADDPMPLYDGTIIVDYRALRQDLVNDFTTVTSYANAEAVLGALNIKNPMSVAAQVINGAIGNLTYRVLPIESDDYNGYIKALDILANNEKVYCIVPLTDDKDVISAYAAHCTAQSQPLKSKWRIMYGSMPMPTTKTVVELNDGRLTYLDDKSVLMKDVTNGKFMTNGCRVGDFIDIYDAYNTYKYSLQLIKVINETTAKFARTLWIRTSEGYQEQIDEEGNTISLSLKNTACRSAGSCCVNSAYTVREVKYECVRILDTQGIAEAICGIAKSFKNKRLRYVMPDTIMLDINGVRESVGGEYLCVALGAMRCSLPPHQGFSTMGISGIARVLNSNRMFTEDQLTEMAAAGVFWVAQDEPEELPYVLYQTTTDNTQLETAEDSIVTVIDYASKYYKDNLKSVLGRYNVNSISLNYVKTVINACSDDMTTTSYEYIGPILTSATLVDLYAEADHIYPTIKIEVPYPVNGVDITLQV